ncbi:MAG: PAS domain S-box protein [Synergistetes bacterium]|nr:PAS domain S-box protein [Synergistota bacterium]
MNGLEKTLRDLKQAYEELTRLRKISEEIGLASSVESVKEVLLRYAERIAPSLKEKYVIFTDENEPPPEIRERWERWKREGVVDWIRRQGKTTVLPEDNLTYIFTPLRVKGKCIGILIISTESSPEEFSQQILQLLDTVAHQAAVGIENVRLYKEIEKMKDFLQEMFNQLLHGILVVSREGGIQAFNKKLLELLKIDLSEDLKGKVIDEAFDEIFSLKLKELMVETFVKGRLIDQEFDYSKGDYRIPLGISSTIFREGGEDSGIIFIVRDLSETKELEKLRKLDKLKSEFISSVSHELRTPLTAIRGFVELMLDSIEELDTETARTYLEIIDDEAERLTRLINNLLDFSRLETGRLNLEMSEFNVEEIVDRAIKMFEGKAKERGLKLYKEIEKNLPPVKGDKHKLLQVLINLLDNAIKYIGDGKRIWVRVCSENGRRVKICVEDEGIGIPKESLPYIFDKFFRVEGDHFHKVSGLGLGLAIAKHIVEAHKGRIWVESEPGVGSKFFFCIPFSQEVDETGEREEGKDNSSRG